MSLKEESLLETPTYVLAIVLLFFQLAALIVTSGMAALKRSLRRRRRPGLLEAATHMEAELMVVGFVSLLLIALEGQLTRICVGASSKRADWSLLHHVYDSATCPCCLAATRSVQACVATAAPCGPDFCNCDGAGPACVLPKGATTYGEAAAVLHPYGAASAVEAGRRLAAALPVVAATCYGGSTEQPGCAAGETPAVTFLGLEQMHLLIFVVSIMHVLCGLLLYAGALARVRLQWARWERSPSEHAAAAATAVEKYYATLGARGGSSGDLEAVAAVGEPGSPKLASAAGSPEARGALGAAAAKPGALAWLKEGAICCVLGVMPTVVSQDQYQVMRASFLVTHRLGAGFEFLEFVQRAMEDDLSHIVGLSLEFWLLITVVVLIAGPFGFPVVIILPVAGLLMVVANGKLAAVTRAVTAAGRVGRLREDVFWLGRPQLLLVPIKAALFVVSFLFGTLLLFLWQFGPDSCPFTTAFYPGWVLPWWTIPIFTGVILAHLAFCTLPTYALAVLMGSSIKANMLPQRLSKKLLALTDTMRRQMAEEREELARSGGEAPELAAAASAQQARRASELDEHKSSRMERMASVVGRRLVGQHGH